MPDITRALWRETLNHHPRGLLVTLASILGLALTLHRDHPPWLPYWVGLSLLLVGARYVLYLKSRPYQNQGALAPHEVSMRRLHRAGVIANGCSWAVLAWWGVPEYDGSQRFTILVILSALAGGSTGTLAPLRAGGKIYIALLLLPACYQLFLFQDLANVTLGVLGLLFCGVMISSHASNYGLLLHAITLSKDKEGLIEQLSGANAELEGRVQERTRSLSEMAQRDLLTGLLNRRGLLTFEQNVGAGTGQLLCIFIDIDRFKHINDAHGHEFGDELLKETSQRLLLGASEMVARLHARQHAVCRWGGDEFVLCLVTAEADPLTLCDATHRLHASLSAPMQVAGLRLQSGVSIGLAHAALCQAPLQEVLGWADLAGAEAKHQGRGRVIIMTDELLRLQRRRSLLLECLATATLDDSLSLHFQPIVCAHQQRVVAMEALLRWNSARAGAISPVEFIPLAESSDHIISIGQWVLRQACAAAAQWRVADGAAPRVAVNTSIKQLVSNQFLDYLMQVLEQTGLAPSRLIIEVTESVFDECHVEQTLSNLLALKHLGVEIHIDDFGTGYSSLSRLQEFPLHAIKIDKSFVQSHDARSWTVIEAAVLIAHSFGLRIIAEGIETAQQAEALARLGVDECQGFWFGRPSADPAQYLLCAPSRVG